MNVLEVHMVTIQDAINNLLNQTLEEMAKDVGKLIMLIQMVKMSFQNVKYYISCAIQRLIQLEVINKPII